MQLARFKVKKLKQERLAFLLEDGPKAYDKFMFCMLRDHQGSIETAGRHDSAESYMGVICTNLAFTNVIGTTLYPISSNTSWLKRGSHELVVTSGYSIILLPFTKINFWLVVWNMFFPYIRDNHPTLLIFFRGVGQPPTRIIIS